MPPLALAPAIALLASLVPALAVAAETPGYPAPGNYRIDTDSVTAMGGGELSTHIDGATGTITTTATMPGRPPTTQTTRGDKPVTWCVKTATAADLARAKASPFACRTSNAQASARNSSFDATCGALAMENSFRQLDPRTWQHSMAFQVSSPANPLASAREAYARAMQSMTPAQRAEAAKELAEMPSQAELDRMQAEMRKELEDAIRTGSPEEAAGARRALQGLQGGAVVQTTRVEERWTLIGSTCQ